ncbi:hypothetical protein [Gilvimarinus japonicus]|uniref:Lipoprotein n=1 Tax=Gilvimarinus japonicus TaxID=1796469 RepID=A0ABV7HS57_9GAMM
MHTVKAGLLLFISVLLSACTSTARFSPSGACAPAVDSTVRLAVQHGEQVQHLLLRTERSDAQTVFVALDTIGSPQFTATLASGQLALERSPLYRGLDPAVLLWGYNWWRLRTTPLSACTESAGLQLHQTATSISLAYQGRPSWYWDAARPQQYDLPQQGGRVTVTPLER